MRRPAVFFDRDNTLIVGSEYLGDPAKVVLVAGAAAGVAKCRSMGFAVVIVSNQSGVARGMFTEDDVQAVNKRMDQMLLDQNPAAIVDRHEYCPFHPEAKVDAYRQDSFMRKPKPGMILAASDAMALDLGRSWMVGDAPRDVAAGQAAGCRTILIVDPSLAPSPAALEPAQVEADFVVGTLIEAIELIAQHTNRKEPASAALTPWDREADAPVPPEKKSPSSTPASPAERAPAERASTVVADRIGPIAAAMVSNPSSPAPTPATPVATGTSPAAPSPAASPAPTRAAQAPASPTPAAAPTTATPARPATAGTAPSPFAVGPAGAIAAPPAKAPAAKPAAARPAPVPAAAPAARPAARAPAATPAPASAAAPSSAASSSAASKLDLSKLEAMNQQMLIELKKFNDARSDDFSVSKLVAGIMQILALAVVPLGYLLHRPNDAAQLSNWLLVAVFLQTFTVALLIMGRQR